MSVPLLITILTFVAVGHPATYKATSGMLGSWVASSDGLPKIGGLFLHAIVFILLAGLLLTLTMPRRSGFTISAFGQSLTVGTQKTEEAAAQ
jgi:hypothetical protein